LRSHTSRDWARLKNTVNTAIQQRATVGITGLLLALYSGLNWMGNFLLIVGFALPHVARLGPDRFPQIPHPVKSRIERQRATVGITGLLLALYSGLNWMGNLREAIRAQSRR
jgi:uncharacterized BrkB/YihY/UPF0761 family membrane protein